MLIHILGSAAGGGFPQWNCGCPNCVGVRNASIRANARTQESVAISADASAWFLLNASPEIRQQIESFPRLHPREKRHSPIQGVVLTNGDLDHCLGLFSLRESHPLVVYASDSVRRGLTEANVIYRTLERFADQVTWRALEEGEKTPLLAGSRESGLTITPFPVPGKLPIHLEGISPPHAGDNIGLRIEEPGTGKTLAYVPSTAAWSEGVERVIAGADCVFFDGTFWSNDELASLGLGDRRAEDMAHWPVGGPGGSLGMLSALGARRRILIHVNNTNPLLREDSRERDVVRAAGVELAFDGMEMEL